MTKDTAVLDRIRQATLEFRKWSPEIWEAVTECRAAPGTCVLIMHEYPQTERFLRDDIHKGEWICGGQKTETEIEGKPLVMDMFYQEGTLVFNGWKGPLPVSNIPFVSL